MAEEKTGGLSEQVFRDAISWLEETKDYRLSPQGRGAYWNALNDTPNGLFVLAVKRVAKEVRGFPVISEIKRERSKIKDHEWREVESREKRSGFPPSRAVESDTNRLLRKIIGDLNHGRITRAEYIEQVRGLDERFPGNGWVEAAESLAKIYGNDETAEGEKNGEQDRRADSDDGEGVRERRGGERQRP